MQISNKREMYALYQDGAFGNKLRTWADINEFLQSDYNGLVTLRYKGGLPGGLANYNVNSIEVLNVVNKLVKSGVNRDLITLNESAPDSRLRIQGEIMRSERGLMVFWSDKKEKMRNALRSGVETVGLAAEFLLKRNLTPSSYGDIQELLDIYEGAVIEFSAYEMCVGCCRHRNHIIWEVRHY